MTKSSPLRLITCRYGGRYCKGSLLIDTAPKYPHKVTGVQRGILGVSSFFGACINKAIVKVTVKVRLITCCYWGSYS